MEDISVWWLPKENAMASKITDDVMDALQCCRLKAYLVLQGEQGVQTTYEKLLIDQRVGLQPKRIEKIRREYSETEVASPSYSPKLPK
jgi:hypothetical protein